MIYHIRRYRNKQGKGENLLLTVAPENALSRRACATSYCRVICLVPSYPAARSTITTREPRREIGPVTRHREKTMQRFFVDQVNSIYRQSVISNILRKGGERSCHDPRRKSSHSYYTALLPCPCRRGRDGRGPCPFPCGASP